MLESRDRRPFQYSVTIISSHLNRKRQNGIYNTKSIKFRLSLKLESRLFMIESRGSWSLTNNFRTVQDDTRRRMRRTLIVLL